MPRKKTDTESPSLRRQSSLEWDSESEDGQEIDGESDFMDLFNEWKGVLLKRDKTKKVAMERTICGVTLSANAYFLYNSTIGSYGGFEQVLREDNSDALDLLKKLIQQRGGKTKNTRSVHAEYMKEFLQLLKQFSEDYDKQLKTVRITQVLALGESPLDKVKVTLIDMSKKLNKFLDDQTSETRRGAIDSQITYALRTIKRELEGATSEINLLAGRGKEQRKRVLWLGRNGIGKTFSINLLLCCSEACSWTYPLKDGSVAEAMTDLTTDAEKIDQVTDNAIDWEQLEHALDSKKASQSNLMMIRPSELDIQSSETELEGEGDYLNALKEHARNANTLGPLASSRGDHLPGYLFTSSSQYSFDSTTLHVTKLREGSTWHFQVTYKSLDEIERALRTYDFRQASRSNDGSSGENVAFEEQRRLYHQVMLTLLRTCVERPAVGKSVRAAAKSTPKGADDDLEFDSDEEVSADDDNIAAYYPREGVPIKFKKSIERIAGKTLVFTSSGENSDRDRIHIRRMLHGVLFEGLFSGFPAPPGTTQHQKKPKLNLEDSILKAPDRFIISEVVVYVPSVLLDGDVEWQDAPGTADHDPQKQFNLQEALAQCDAVMMFNDRTLDQDSDLRRVFTEYVVPRLWVRDCPPIQIRNFQLMEKSYRDGRVILAQRNQTQGGEVYESRMAAAKAVRKAVLEYKPPHSGATLSPEWTQQVKTVATAMVSSGTWPIMPLMYTSLLQDSDSRLNFEFVSTKEWNPYGKSELAELPTIRDVVLEATAGSFGRKFVEALFSVSMSSVQLVLKRLRLFFREAHKKLATALNDSPETPSDKLKGIAKERFIATLELYKDCRESTASRFDNEFQIDFGARVKTDAYVTVAKSAFTEKVLSKMRKENKPAQAIDYLNREKAYNARNCFLGLDVLAELKFEDVIQSYVKFLERLMQFLRDSVISFMKDRVKLEKKDADWLDQHTRLFVNSDEANAIVRKKLGTDMLLLVPSLADMVEEDQRDIRQQKEKQELVLRKDLLDASRRTLNALFEAEMPVLKNKADRKEYDVTKGERERTELVLRKLEDRLASFDSKVKERLVDAVQAIFKERKQLLRKRAFLMLGNAMHMLFVGLRESILRFQVVKNARRQVSGNIGYALGFIKNRLLELKMSSKLDEDKDSQWFESWVKMKFVLQDFAQESGLIRTPSTLKLWLEGTPDWNSRQKSIRKSDDRGGFIGAYDKALDRTKLGRKGDFIYVSTGEHEEYVQIVQVDGNSIVYQEEGKQVTDIIHRENINFAGNELLYFDDKYQVKVIKDDSGSGTCTAVFIGSSPYQTRDLHMRVIEQESGKTSMKGLIDAIKMSVGMGQIDSELLRKTWIKLVEAAFPVEPLKQATGQESSDNSNKPTASLFDDWFGEGTLKLLLESFSSIKPLSQDIEARLAVPLLLGAAEMFGLCFLVRVGSREYCVEPHVRESEMKNRIAYSLRWSKESGFRSIQFQHAFNSIASSEGGDFEEPEVVEVQPIAKRSKMAGQVIAKDVEEVERAQSKKRANPKKSKQG